MGGGSSTTESFQQNEPWGPAQPYIKEALAENQNLFHWNQPSTYHNLVPGFAPMQELAMYGTAQRALQGSPLEQGAQGVAWDQMYGSQSPYSNFLMGAAYDPLSGAGQALPYAFSGIRDSKRPNPAFMPLGDTAYGGKLNSNPMLDNMFDAQSSAITRQFQEATVPGNQAAFGAAGRLRGGNAPQGGYNNQAARSEQELMEGLERTGANVYGNAYNMERGLQEQASANLGNIYNNWMSNQRLSISDLANIFGQGAQNQLNAAQLGGNQFYSGMQNQLQAANQGTQMAQVDYRNLSNLFDVGQQQQTQLGNKLADASRVHDWYQSGPGSPIGTLGRYLNPAMAAGQLGGTSYGMQESSQDPGFLSYLSGATSLLGALPGFSDKRMKQFITRVGVYGPLEIFTWQWRDHGIGGLTIPQDLRGTWDTGFIAQDVQDLYPDSVFTDRGGRLKIRYDMLADHLSREDKEAA